MIHVSVDEAARDFRRLAERVNASNETVVVEREGTPLAMVSPLAAMRKAARRRPSEADYAAALAAAGNWADVDIDAFLVDNARSRHVSEHGRLMPP